MVSMDGVGHAEMRGATLTVMTAALCSALQALPSHAHHSGVLWDSTRTVTLTGTVREFQWTNPHCWIQLLVADGADASGTAVEWSVEMAAPGQVLRGGWKPGTLMPGQRIRVTIHPARDGTHAGNFVSASGPAGEPLGMAAAIRP